MSLESTHEGEWELSSRSFRTDARDQKEACVFRVHHGIAAGPDSSARFPLGPILVLLLSLAVAGGRTASAQSHYGKDFWLADCHNGGAAGISIAIGNPGSVTANVTLFNTLELTTTDTVAPDSVKLFPFPAHDLGLNGTVISSDPVYHVTSDVDVAVFLFEPLANAFSNDAALIRPTESLGVRHRVANYCNPGGNSAGQFLTVIAVTPGSVTTVQVFDDTGALVDTANLLSGECFQRINHIGFGCVAADDMTGWEIVSDDPVAVFSGSVGTSVGTPADAADFVFEQLLDENQLAVGYVVAPLRTRPLGCTSPASCAADVFRFVATEDGTTLTTVPSVGGGTIDEGEFLEIATAESFIITGDRPFFGYQYLPSTGALFGSNPPATVGDPALVNLLPVEQFRSDYIFHSDVSFPANFINIVAPAGASLLLDGSAITADCEFIGTLAGTDYCSIRLEVTPGTHTVTSDDSDFGLTVSGFSFYGSYAYPAGMGNPCETGVDGWMQDTPIDVGEEPNPDTSPMWESQDIWVRNLPDPTLQHQHEHQNPISGSTNYVYVKLRNRGCEPLTSGVLKTYFAKASTGLSWDSAWVSNFPDGDLIGSEPVVFVASNGSKVLEYEWTPTAGGHFCLLARLESPDDPMTFTEGTNVNVNTRNNNNIAWKNVTVVLGFQGARDPYSFIARNIRPAPATIDLEFVRTDKIGALPTPAAHAPFFRRGLVLLTLPPAMFQAWQQAGGVSQGVKWIRGTTTFDVLSPNAKIEGISMGIAEEHSLAVKFAPSGVGQLDSFVVSQISHLSGVTELDGGVTYVFEAP